MGQKDLFSTYETVGEPLRDKYEPDILDLETVHQRIKDYSTGTNYTPLKIVFLVQPPLYMKHPYVLFDSVISHLCLRECLGGDYYKLPSDRFIDLSDLQLPIKRTDDVYHASVSRFDEPVKLTRTRIFKRFDDQQAYNVAKFKVKKITINSGIYKSFVIDTPTVITDTVTFYTCADKKSIEELLKHLTHIGKNSNLGGGRVIDYTIEETDEDYSWFKDRRPMRPIPIRLLSDMRHGYCISMQTYKAPYQSKKNAELCVSPENQLLKEVLL